VDELLEIPLQAEAVKAAVALLQMDLDYDHLLAGAFAVEVEIQAF
jgi:hypothetical protein